jgi:hypothetical protein
MIMPQCDPVVLLLVICWLYLSGAMLMVWHIPNGGWWTISYAVLWPVLIVASLFLIMVVALAQIIFGNKEKTE